ncbi:MAG: SAM-dependent DNA methyltransferase [Spirochaetes bacterium]|nr:SAM-dependent DNA methyltransferase [Spirochaetota bacterium]MBN2772183.1 SAM-dependent DNA methyltransferase [Spirochaetota bacterium]
MTTEQLKQLEQTLWQSADTLRANSDLKSSEYATPVLGLIFLRFADNKYSQYEEDINKEYNKLKSSRRERKIEDIAIEKCGFYLPEKARYEYLLRLPEEEDIAKALKEAMELIEKNKPELSGVLPKDEYFKLVRKQEFRDIPVQLLKNFADIPRDASGDMFGQIYEYFLGKFAMAEGQGGGEFFTPRSVVRLMVEIIEPHDGTVFDPACGSGGMFVQSSNFIEERKKAGLEPDDNSLYVYGQEKTLETVKLAKMNLAVNGLRGEVHQANTYYEDPVNAFGRFDYVLANPPFNVDDVSLARVDQDKRFNIFGVPRNKTRNKKKGEETCPNGNYLWINIFASSLSEKGRAGLVMANSASDARHSEAEIRQKLIESNLIYAMVTLPSNMFYTVTLPATLWFFDKAKEDKNILFIDTRNIFTQIDRAHREFSAEQIHNVVLISKLHKGDRQAFVDTVQSYFKKGFGSFAENMEQLQQLSGKVSSYLKAYKVKKIPDFSPLLIEAKDLIGLYKKNKPVKDIDAYNTKQRTLSENIKPFFEKIHSIIKELDREIRQLQKEHKKAKDLTELQDLSTLLHQDVKDTEYFFNHISWLQERFPEAQYEDVTGLCKLASIDEVKEQEYSLNPGRYVGVVIEEDGKTEEEFIAEIVGLNDELEALNKEALQLEKVISHNIRAIAGE